jgi:hypothetical protein
MATHFSAILAYDLSTRSSSTVLAGSRTGSVVFNVSSDLSTDGSQVFLNQADGVRAFDNTNGSGFLGEDILWRAYWTPRQGYSILSVTLNNPSMVNTLLGYNPGANPQDYDLPRGDIDGDLSQTNLATKPKTLLPQNLLAWGGRVYLLNHWNLRYLE